MQRWKDGGLGSKEDLRNEEDEEGDGVAVAFFYAEILFHAGDTCDGKVGAINTVDGIHQTQDWDEAEIDLPSKSAD